METGEAITKSQSDKSRSDEESAVQGRIREGVSRRELYVFLRIGLRIRLGDRKRGGQVSETLQTRRGSATWEGGEKGLNLAARKRTKMTGLSKS